MGRPKALLRLDGVPLVAHHVRGLARVCDRVAVVLGAHRHEIEPHIPDVAYRVVNPHWASTGPSDSVRVATLALDLRGDLVVTPVDVLPPRDATLRTLMQGPAPTVPVGPGGRRGHPVRLGASQLQRLRHAAIEGGLRTLLTDARHVDVDDIAVVGDFDDPVAWERARRTWVGRRGTTG